MIKQFSWLIMGRVVAASMQLISLALLVNWVSPSEFGIVVATIGVAVVPLAFLDFGVTTYTLKAWAQVAARPKVMKALKFSNNVCLGFGVFAAISLCMASYFFEVLTLSLLPLAVWAAAERNADTWLSITLAQGRSHINTANLVGRRAIALVAMVGVMSWTQNGVLAYASGSALGALCSVFYARRVLAVVVGAYKPAGSLSQILASARPFWVHSFATQIRNLDTFLVAMIASPAQAGFYGVASKLSGPLRMVPTSVAPILIPAVARNGLNKKTTIFIAAILSGMSIIYVALAFSANVWVSAVFGASYKPAVVAVQITCLGLVFGATASILGALLQALGKQVMVARTSIVASAVCILAISVGALMGGATGAALGMVTSFVVQSVVFAFGLLRYALKGAVALGSAEPNARSAQ